MSQTGFSGFRLYKDYPHASIQMVADEQFQLAIPHHDYIIESGTYTGLGSSQMLARTRPVKMVTIESDFNCFRQAVNNLEKFPFITPYWGLSVDRNEAIDFIVNNQDYYLPEVFVDDTDPISFYLNEVSVPCFKENLLEHFLTEFADKNPLILLDSAGGIGFLEYSIVRKVMGSKPHSLILDDTHHVKHYRSRLDALNHYSLIYDDTKHGRSIFAMYPSANNG
jgi:hypothetical protein